MVSCKKGISLIEIIVSFVIIFILLVSFLSAFVGGLKNIMYSGKRTKAFQEARRVMEIITEEVGGRSAYTVDDINNIISNSGSEYNIVLEYEPDFTPVSDTTIKMNKVTLKVFYNEGKNYVTLTSLLNQ